MNKNSFSLIQLNCRSIRNKLGEIKLMVYAKKPHVVVLSETWLTKYIPRFVGYVGDWNNRNGFAGGTGFLIKSGVAYRTLFLTPYNNGYLEFQAIKIDLEEGGCLNLLHVYNPGRPVSEEEFKHYINQLGNNFILLGDFNAHSKMLHSKCVVPNVTGRSLEKLVANNNVCLANPYNFYTYTNAHTGKRSCLDLCFASPGLVSMIQMTLLQDVGSDHMPISVSINKFPKYVAKCFLKKWVTNNDNLSEFSGAMKRTVGEVMQPNDINTIDTELTDRIVRVATETIPKTSGKQSMRKRTSWWNIECSRAVAARRYARKRLEKYPNERNAQLYKEKTAEARRLCRMAKRESFQSYVETLQYDTPTGAVWRKIRSLKSNIIVDDMPIVVDGNLVTESVIKADLYAEHLQKISQAGGHIVLDDFESKLKLASTKIETQYNNQITLQELEYALATCKNRSPGIDDIPNILLKNLPQNILLEILSLFNQSFKTGHIPDSWKVGVVVPIWKPAKDKSKIESYRPIALLPCIGKLMEKVIQRRLQYIVNEQKFLQNSQFGFCKGENTMDVHCRIEHIIRKCLECRDVCLVVYIDLSSAFDTVWPQGLIYKLMDKGLKGNLLVWLYNYFQNRMITVRVNGRYSKKVAVNAGTPQGVVLSPILFNLMLSDLPDCSIVETHVYADDITLTCTGTNLRAMKKCMQLYLEELNIWMKTWGMKINVGKTYMQYFTRRRLKCPILKLGDQVIKYKKVHKLLGLFYDSPLLNWKAHIDMLHADCLKRIDLLKVISSANWGASCKILRLFYMSYIRSKIDYGAILYCSAAMSNLKKLDNVQNACCRLVLGARKSSPVLSLQAEAHIPPLELRRGYLAANKLIKLYCKPKGYANAKKFNLDKNSVPLALYPVNSFISRAKKWEQLLNLNLKRVPTETMIEVPPWNDSSALYVYTTYDESLVYNNATFVDHFRTMFDKYEYCFTDGSKGINNESYVGCATYFPCNKQVHSYRLHPDHSVVFSELFAIRQALEHIEGNTECNYLVFSDSQAALQLIVSNSISYISIVGQIKRLLCNLNQGRKVLLHWVRGHCNIQGNEIADKAAKYCQ